MSVNRGSSNLPSPKITTFNAATMAELVDVLDLENLSALWEIIIVESP